MSAFKWLQQLFQYIGDAAGRIFSPSRDDYPETGVQPFEGEPYKENEENS